MMKGAGGESVTKGPFSSFSRNCKCRGVARDTAGSHSCVSPASASIIHVPLSRLSPAWAAHLTRYAFIHRPCLLKHGTRRGAAGGLLRFRYFPQRFHREALQIYTGAKRRPCLRGAYFTKIDVKAGMLYHHLDLCAIGNP